ncbi:MOSC domain-containing protein [Actinocatenispora sera]|uniref:Molybdenum cofactor biosysynthesis protein n=1 Tax=Actinocatenispora sera TaxID=390989 RepID=A0A810L353_9ACTN|nr:MOSC domain-containing protein [Actinocatenispora sera]BCJ28588.1 molybdenum cofactor biosysynthesis protein [Actinocatenispora sera]
MIGTVTRIRRYPVKSMLGEDLPAGTVGSGGLAGDRAFAVLDGSGAVGSAKHPRKWGPLLACRASQGGDSRVDVVLPDGSAHVAGAAELDQRLSELLGRPARMSDQPPRQARLERAVPDYDGGAPQSALADSVLDATGTRVTSVGIAAGSFLDFGALHAVTTSTLQTLRGRAPGPDFDPRRFRPNLVIDTGSVEGFPEDEWPGRRIRIGETVLEAIVPTPRCVVPTLAHGELPADPTLMRAVAREHRIPVLTLGSLTCVGVYLKVLTAGPVRVGDPVTMQ